MSAVPRAPRPGHETGRQAATLAVRRRDLLVPVAVTLALHVVLLAGQGLAAAMTGSLAIRANALHVGVDTVVHLVALGGVWQATRPANPRHPYGYERYETLASLLIGMLLLAVVVLIVAEAMPRLVAPEAGRATGVGAAVMAASAVASGALAIYLGRRGRRLDSRVLRSEAVHAAADSLIALGVLVAVAAGGFGVAALDPIAALLVAGVVAWRGWAVVRGAAAVLTDAAAIDTEAIREAALRVPGVRDCHAVRSRGEAGHVRVDLHVHVAPELTIAQGHAIAVAVEDEVRRLDSGIAEVLVHLGADQSVG
jgi:cation diffusion facilitator family transporter